MMTYVFKCRRCGTAFEQFERELGDMTFCGACGSFDLGRDYRGENVGLGNATVLRHEREAGGVSNQMAAMLPSNRDFASATDPDGSTGMSKWRDEHGPRESNKNPHYPGDVPKRVFGYGGKGRVQ